jgi:hypothetical protein
VQGHNAQQAEECLAQLRSQGDPQIEHEEHGADDARNAHEHPSEPLVGQDAGYRDGEVDEQGVAVDAEQLHERDLNVHPPQQPPPQQRHQERVAVQDDAAVGQHAKVVVPVCNTSVPGTLPIHMYICN